MKQLLVTASSAKALSILAIVIAAVVIAGIAMSTPLAAGQKGQKLVVCPIGTCNPHNGGPKARNASFCRAANCRK